MISGLRHALLTGAVLLALAACGSTGQVGTVPAQRSSAGPAAEAGAGLGSVSAAAPASSAPAAVPRNPGGAVLVVGPGHAYRTPCQAIAAAKAGDTVQIDAKGNGGYAGDVCGWSTDGLMIVGFNGRAHVDAAGKNSQGKGTWVIAGKRTTVDNVELSGATVPDGNGAAIRQEGAGLTLRRSFLHDNQNGILAGDNAASDIVVESTELARNGAGDGYTHNLYLGHVRSFTMRYSWSHDARVGHLVKSRALVNDILYNRITGENGSGSYEIDLPDGGRSRIVGNVVQQGKGSQNPNIIAYGEEGSPNPGSRLTVAFNTIVNDLGRGTAIMVGSGITAPVVVQNNILAGGGTLVSQGGASTSGNCTAADPRFADRAGLDYHLAAGSPCIDKGVTPGADAAAAEQYVHPLSHRARAATGAGPDPGAFE
ncbi:hypothetical protein Dvina_30405 [Dactylosporangium vinaceum]|uniref:Right handed beta helix domain-containing protein n=1 Tax=Dactylosporangium vinaceum TaxID=53362 RepID=A0ABV5MJR5_9ACTN|nr:hypothetical protein [Dactylosporangium vinaceum]UAB92641.1 hypothetical protein Dvina_30405 [Dactylosporangium vinaceum]